MYTFKSLNQALVGMSKELLSKGVSRKTRGHDCIEMPHPVLICIENPSDRYVNIPERKWNKMLPFVESLWLALGMNDLGELPGNYVKNLYNFSDDGQFWRGGYGPRLRAYTGNYSDYKISNPKYKNVFRGGTMVVDQFKYIVEAFKRDINTRQAIVQIGDPAKDLFESNEELKKTKDFPCTRSLHFQVNTEGKMDLIIDIRSNDILWGFSAVNVFNFTLIQEYIANMVGVPVGKYYHKADNFHYYENFKDKIESFAKYDLEDFPAEEPFYYKDNLLSLENFDALIEILFDYEKGLRIAKRDYSIDLGNDMMNDWARVFKNKWCIEKSEFKNPYLNKLFYENKS